MLIPELVVRRGQTYTFIVEAGDDPANSAEYHPFYITDSPNGGRVFATAEERSVSWVINGVSYYQFVVCRHL